MYFQIKCIECNEIIAESILDSKVNQLISRHAFSPIHASVSRARIRAARLVKEINGVLDEFEL